MKKIFAISILTVILFSCASSGSGTADSPVSLERAIELAAEHIAGDLNPGTRIAIVDFESANDNLSHHIMEELTGELLKHKIEIADRQNLPYIFQEFELQMSGAVSDETVQSLGKILGAELIIVGRLLDIVTMYRNQVDAVHVELATRESAARNNVRKDQALRRMITALANQQTTVKVYRYGVTEQTNPETAGVFLDRGIMFAMRGEYDKAIADFTESIRLNPDMYGAYMLRAMALTAKVSRVFRLEENFSGMSIASYTGERAAAEQIQIYDRAIADYNQALRLDPNNAFAYTSRGTVYGDKGDYDREIADHTEAIRLIPNFATAYSNRGIAYANKSDYDRAIADFTAALRIKPDSYTILNNRGTAYYYKGDYNRALADWAAALSINPDFSEALYNRGNAYLNNRDYDRAIADFNTALNVKPDYYEVLTSRGSAYAGKGNVERAIADYTAALRIKPDFYRALNNRGLAYYHNNDIDRAIADYTAALRIKPDYHEALFNRGAAYDDKYDVDRAIADYTAALRIKPDYYEALFNRGIDYAMKRDYDRAIADWEAVLRINPNDANAQQLIQRASQQRAGGQRRRD